MASRYQSNQVIVRKYCVTRWIGDVALSERAILMLLSVGKFVVSYIFEFNVSLLLYILQHPQFRHLKSCNVSFKKYGIEC